MVTAEGNELFADRTSTVLLFLACSRVLYDFLHLSTRRQMTIFILTSTSVNQGLYATLDAFFFDAFRVNRVVGSLY